MTTTATPVPQSGDPDGRPQLVYVRCDRCGVPTEADASADAAPVAVSLRDAQRRAVDVILDHLDPPAVRLGRPDWAMNVVKIARALARAGLLAHQTSVEETTRD